jgi:hypothetical protein
MVRLEERPWRAQATLLLDTRARAHLLGTRHAPAARIGPAGDDDPPTDSLEWLIEAAASIGTTLADRGAVLRAVTDAGELAPTSGRGRLSPEDLLDRLAGLGPTRVPELRAGVELVRRAAGEGPVICLLGAVGPDDVVELIRGCSGPSNNAAILLDVESWADAGVPRSRRGSATTARGVLAGHRDDAAALLRSAGWRVAVATADRSVADVWAALGGPVGERSASMAAGSLGSPA